MRRAHVQTIVKALAEIAAERAELIDALREFARTLPTRSQIEAAGASVRS